MASFTKAQFDLGNAGLIEVYTCPAKKVVPVTVYLCNRGGGAGTFRIAIAPNGEADDVKHYIYYDSTLPNQNALKEAFTLANGDALRVQIDGPDASCSVFVDEERVMAP